MTAIDLILVGLIIYVICMITYMHYDCVPNDFEGWFIVLLASFVFTALIGFALLLLYLGVHAL